MAGSRIVREAVEDQRHFGSVQHFNFLESGIANRFGNGLRYFFASFHDDFTGPLVGSGINDIVDCNFFFNLANAATVNDLFAVGFVEGTNDICVSTVLGVHGTQQHHGGEFAALVNTDTERVLLRDVYFDPAATFGDNTTAGKLAIAGSVSFHDEIHSRTAMQLADNNSFGPVNNKLPATEHDGQVTEKDVFFDRFVFVQSQTDLKGAAVGES